jgi:uncharacterized membrane protein YphA (DoxX/SURF4 family)
MAAGRALNTVLWVLQGLLALVYVYSGGMKFVMPIEEMTKVVALPGAFLHFIGVAEIAGGLGMILPGLTGIRPGLTPLAAAGLVIIMAGATLITAATMGAVALIPLAVGLAVAFVGYGRWRLAPLRARSRPSPARPSR